MPVISYPVQIRGVTYPSALEAAKAMGCSRGTIYARISRGTLDDIVPHRPKTVKVKIRGKTYDSPASAAKALGVGVNAVYSALSRGNPDVVGLGPGKGKATGGAICKPVQIGPLRFPSRRAASLALGKSKSWISDFIYRTGDMPPDALPLAMNLARKRERAALIALQRNEVTCVGIDLAEPGSEATAEISWQRGHLTVLRP